MYTQCPQCRTIFEIDEDALQASLGIVRCGHCAERFDALRTLSNTLPADSGALLPQHDPDTHAPTLTQAITARATDTPDPRGATNAVPGTDNDDDWLSALGNEQASALIAEAAGIPRDAIQGDSAWQVTDVPVESGGAESDGIPMDFVLDPHTPAPPSATLAHPLAVSEPFTAPWGLDIPDTGAVGPNDSVLATTTEPPDTRSTSVPQLQTLVVADATDMPPPVAQPGGEPPADAALPTDTAAGEGAPTGNDASPLATEPPVIEADADAEPVVPATELPVYVPPRVPWLRRSDGLWALGCAALVLVLAAQVAWASRISLVGDPATQAWALRACAHLDCRLPPIRAIAQLQLLSRDVRPDPDAKGALVITATFRNNARIRQPWPVVMVALTDLDNNVIAMRRFRPAEYMPDPARRAAGIGAGTTAAVAFEVADPGSRAVSFRFGFE